MREFPPNQKNIPQIIRKALKSWKIDLANADEPYQATDVVLSKNIPKRQIISIFKNSSHFLMTYNHGGRGHHTHIMYFRYGEDQIFDFWVGNGVNPNQMQSMVENLILLTSIKRDGRVSNYLEY